MSKQQKGLEKAAVNSTGARQPLEAGCCDSGGLSLSPEGSRRREDLGSESVDQWKEEVCKNWSSPNCSRGSRASQILETAGCTSASV